MFHTTTQNQAAKFLKLQKRNYYVTPTSYLELINSFKRLLGEKRTEVAQQRDRYGNGYKQLIATEESVGAMQVNLENLKPQLVVKSKEVDEQAKVVEAESAIAEKEQEKVEAETAVAQVAADKTEAIKTDCQRDLDEALPALEAAAKALNAIGQKDVAELRTIQKFHDDVMRVFQAVCVLLGHDPVKKMNPETQKREEDWLTPAKKVLADINFLRLLKEYDKDNMEAKRIDRI